MPSLSMRARFAAFKLDQEQVELLAIEHFNCTNAQAYGPGEIWIDTPMTGHWLQDDKLAAFADWIVQRRNDEGTA